MKHLIVLPGNNARNKAWGEAMRDHYANLVDSVYVQEYDHWGRALPMDMKKEEEKLRSHVASVTDTAEIIVFAKSAGSILCLCAVQAGFLRPAHCVFFGMPFEWAITDVFAGNWEIVESFSYPAVAFHNDHDPTATHGYTERVIRERMKTVSLVTTEGTDHEYADFAFYDRYLLPILQT